LIREENSLLLPQVTIAERTRWHLWRHACLVCLLKRKRSVDWPLITNQNIRYTSQESFARHIWYESDAVHLSSIWNEKLTGDLKRRWTIFCEGNAILAAKIEIETLYVCYQMLVSRFFAAWLYKDAWTLLIWRSPVARSLHQISQSIRFFNLY